jgi:transcriptional regulator
MYLPNRFKVEDQVCISQVINGNPLATIITANAAESFISHLPLEVMETEPQLKLIGHMARANKHWKYMAEHPLTKIIFHGPNTYITPTWYAENDVPTWNYAVVHVSGQVKLIEDFNGIVKALQMLSNRMEAAEPKPWEFWLPDDLRSKDDLTGAIVAFEIVATDITAKFGSSAEFVGSFR